MTEPSDTTGANMLGQQTELPASPEIFEADCKTPRQMQLANGFCRYLELSETLSV